MLVTSIFSFSHNVFYPSQNRFQFSFTFILSSANAFNLDQSENMLFGIELKVALQILGRKFYKNTKESSLYFQSFLNFIHRTPVVERHPMTREIRDLLWPLSTPTGNTVYFYMSSSFIYTLKIQTKLQTWRWMRILWKIITCLLCYGI